MPKFEIGNEVINHTGTGTGDDLSVYTDGEIGRVVRIMPSDDNLFMSEVDLNDPYFGNWYAVTFTDEDWDVWYFYETELTRHIGEGIQYGMLE